MTGQDKRTGQRIVGMTEHDRTGHDQTGQRTGHGTGHEPGDREQGRTTANHEVYTKQRREYYYDSIMKYCVLSYYTTIIT